MVQTTRCFHFALVVGLISFCAGFSPAVADIVNGSFETGNLVGWGQGGNGGGWVSAKHTSDNGLTPTVGSFLANMGNSAMDGGGNGWIWLAQDFWADKGEVLEFDFAAVLQTSTVWPGQALAKASVNLYHIGQYPSVERVEYSIQYVVGWTTFNTGGWTSESWTIPSSGSYTIELAVETTTTFSDPSFAFASANGALDNVRLTPEPASLGLLALGGLGLLRRRRGGDRQA